MKRVGSRVVNKCTERMRTEMKLIWDLGRWAHKTIHTKRNLEFSFWEEVGSGPVKWRGKKKKMLDSLGWRMGSVPWQSLLPKQKERADYYFVSIKPMSLLLKIFVTSTQVRTTTATLSKTRQSLTNQKQWTETTHAWTTFRIDQGLTLCGYQIDSTPF